MTANRAEQKEGGSMTLAERLRRMAEKLYAIEQNNYADQIDDLADEVEGKVLVPVEVAKRLERWAMKASFEYAHDASDASLPQANRERWIEDTRQATADAQAVSALLKP